MKKMCVMLLLMLAVLAAAPAWAVEVPGVSPIDFGGSPDAGWVWTFLGSSTAMAIVAAIGKIVQSIISRIRDERIAKACGFVYAGTITCYQEYVRVAKVAHADGKLTLDEKTKPCSTPTEKRLKLPARKGWTCLKSWAKT